MTIRTITFHEPRGARRRSACRAAGVTLALAVPLALASCTSGNADDSGSAISATMTGASSASSTVASKATMAAAVTTSDTWAKAADKGMSAAFGTLKNTSAKPVVITGARGDAGPVQLHVTTKTANGMEMKETTSFTVPAGGSLELAPGGNHLMFMDLSHALKAGDAQKLTVTFEDGSHVDITFPVRAYDGAKEKYAGSGMSSMSGMSGMSSAAH